LHGARQYSPGTVLEAEKAATAVFAKAKAAKSPRNQSAGYDDSGHGSYKIPG